MINKTLSTVLLLFVLTTSSFAQNGQQLSGHEMDFWVGEWDLTWTVNGDEGGGTNSVTKTLGGAVIHEHFSGIYGPNGGYLGESFTTFNPRSQTYYQTWVDMNGGYLDFTFNSEDDKYIFIREVDFGQGPVRTRMVFYNIKPHSFTWDWQRYNFETEEWATNWQIIYQRKNKIENLSLDKFRWMTGRWTNNQNGTQEVWKYSDDQSMLEGYAVSFNEETSDSTITEQLKIIEKDGTFIFIAHPASSSTPTEFPIISATDKNFVSYNPDHDFPKRVEYHRLDENRLGAIIKDEKQMQRFLFRSN